MDNSYSVNNSDTAERVDWFLLIDAYAVAPVVSKVACKPQSMLTKHMLLDGLRYHVR